MGLQHLIRSYIHRYRENKRAMDIKEVVHGGKMTDVLHRIMRKPNK